MVREEQQALADLDAVAKGQRSLTLHLVTVEQRAVARREVLEEPPVGAPGDARVTARHLGVVELETYPSAATEDQLVAHRDLPSRALSRQDDEPGELLGGTRLRDEAHRLVRVLKGRRGREGTAHPHRIGRHGQFLSGWRVVGIQGHRVGRTRSERKVSAKALCDSRVRQPRILEVSAGRPCHCSAACSSAEATRPATCSSASV